MQHTKYGVNYFRFSSRRPVEDFIEAQPSSVQAKIYKYVAVLHEYGSHAGWPVVKRIEKGLFELRIRGIVEVRLIFVCAGNDVMILHGFIKKTQKLPLKELRLAKKRLTLLSHM